MVVRAGEARTAASKAVTVSRMLEGAGAEESRLRDASNVTTGSVEREVVETEVRRPEGDASRTGASMSGVPWTTCSWNA